MVFSAIAKKYTFKKPYSKESVKIFESLYEIFYPNEDYESIDFRERVFLGLYGRDYSSLEETVENLTLDYIHRINVGDITVVLENSSKRILYVIDYNSDRPELVINLLKSKGYKLHPDSGSINFWNNHLPTKLLFKDIYSKGV